MRARIRLEGETAEWFSLLDDQFRSRRLPPALAASVLFHIIGFAVIAQAARYLTPYQPRPAEHVPILHLRLPKSIVYFPPRHQPQPANLPRLPVAVARSQQTLWQPHVTAPAPDIPVAAPNLLLLTAPPPGPKPFVDPGHQQAPAKARVILDSVDLNVTPARYHTQTSTTAAATLPKLPTGGRPLISEPAIAISATTVASVPKAGDPLALVSVNPANLAPREIQAVPRVSQQAAVPPGNGLSQGQGTSPVVADAPPLPAPPNLAAAAKPIEVIHPDNRVFDVVVVRSAPSDESNRALFSSQPIYSAYLEVGAQQHWLLEYCAAGSAIKRTGIVVTLPSPVKLQAPYPRRTIIPPSGQLRSPSRTVIRGILASNGQFRDLALVNGAEQFATLLLPYLAQWEFRPASQNGKATDVEIVLSIPILN